MTKMNDARYEWFDIAKGIAILGIVVWHIQVAWIDHPLLHAHELTAGLWPVPVFFILAGFFLTDAKLQQPKDFIIKKGRRLYVPTVCLYIIATLLHNMFVDIGFYSLNMDYDGSYITLYSLGDTIKGVVLSILLAGQELMLAPMWFACVLFVALCVMSIVCYVLKRYAANERQYQNWQLFAFLLPYIIYTLAMLVHPIEIPRYHHLFAAVWLIYAGMLMHTRLHLTFNSGIGAAVCALAVYGCSIFPANGYVAHTVSSLAACYLLCYMSKAIAKKKTVLSRLLAVIGRESFYIMALHLLGFKICTLLLNAFGADACLSALTPTVGSHVLLFIAYLAAGALLPIAFMLVYRRAKGCLLNCFRNNT